MLIRRFEFNDTQRFDKPIGINRNHRSNRTDWIKIVTTVPHFVRTASCPNPKNGIVAAEVEFLSAQTGCGTLNPQPFRAFKCQSGMERQYRTRYVNGGVFGDKIVNILTVSIDCRRNFFECRLCGSSKIVRRRRLWAFEQFLPGGATCQAEAHQQKRYERRYGFHSHGGIIAKKSKWSKRNFLFSRYSGGRVIDCLPIT